MNDWNPAEYHSELKSLLAEAPATELGPGKPNEAARGRLASLTAEQLCDPHSVVELDMARCCLSGLWLRHNFLDESHTISQSISTSSGSYWHAIMHRREPDFSNSKYWYRRVGSHVAFSQISGRAGELTRTTQLDSQSDFLLEQDEWDPFRFVDLCEVVLRGQAGNREVCERIAELEWECLFDDCYRRAVGIEAKRP